MEMTGMKYLWTTLGLLTMVAALVHTQDPTLQACTNTTADIVFMLDVSGSVTLDNYLQLSNFTANLVQSMNIGKDKTRVGVFSFSNDAAPYFYLDDYDNNEDIIAVLMNYTRSFRPGDGTNIDVGLNYMVDVMLTPGKGARPEVKDFGIVITDGQGSNVSATAAAAQRAKDMNVTLIAVGVGPANKEELKSIASGSDYFTVDSFQDLQTIEQNLIDMVCQKPVECVHALVTIVGLGVAIFCLTLTVVTFLIRSCRKLSHGQSQSTLFSMALAVLLSWAIYLAGFTQVQEGALCLTVAALLHYVILTSFLWLMMEALLQFLLSFSNTKNYLAKVSAFAWGLPVIPVAVVLIMDMNLYRTGNKCCWMSQDPFPQNYTLFAPLGAIVIATITLDLLTMIAGCCGTPTTADRTQPLLSFICLLLPLAASWICFYASYIGERADSVMEYLFPVSAALHGFFVLLVFTLRSPLSPSCCGGGGQHKSQNAVHPQ